MELRELLLSALELCEPPKPKKTLSDIISEGQSKIHEAVEAVIAKHENEINAKANERREIKEALRQSDQEINMIRRRNASIAAQQNMVAFHGCGGLFGLGDPAASQWSSLTVVWLDIRL